ncbi:uncharacterized protein [Anabrus simplex]|uniref:uncharacterized protein isoform X1 n=1 Tax=Anabrus simplex TaxID=316456 RepID=UPI0035A394DB
MNPAGAQKLNPAIVNDYFNKLDVVLSKLGLKSRPQNIYYMDEKGVRLTLHHKQHVLSKTGAKRVHIVSREHAENVTVVACTNAIGNVIPPVVLFKGVRCRKSFKAGLPPCSRVLMTTKGSMTGEVFVKWIEHFAQYKPPGPTLLIMDGTKCHLDISIVDEAEEHEITLFCLPNSTTHELQPLDKAVFCSFEHYWDQQLLHFREQYPEDPDRKLTKDTFSEVFTPVWGKCMNLSNISNGFRAMGIYPFDRTVIPEEAFAPSSVRHREEEQDVEDNAPLSERLAALSLGSRDSAKMKNKINSPFQELMPSSCKKIKKTISAPRKKAITTEHKS